MAADSVEWPAPCDQSLDAQAKDERLRMRTLARYFLPAQITADTLRAISGQPVAPTLSQDTHLTALAQLGPLKLQCDRAFISLLSTSTQFIIAEATRSISLRQTNRFRGQQDALFLGVQALHKSYGVCPNTVNIFTDATGTLALTTHDIVANSARYIIRDFRALDLFKDRPYVVGFPNMRSYAEVPLTSANGRVIGSYCVVDDEVRDDFFDEDTTFVLSEIAESIVKYLDNVNVQHTHARGERLMEGLSMFAENKSTTMSETNLRKERRAWARSKFSLSDQDEARQAPADLWPSSSHSTRHLSASTSTSATNDTHGDETTFLTTPSEGSRPLESPASSECLASPLEKPAPLENRFPKIPSTNNPTSDIFTRAAAIIRDALDIDGIAFLGAANKAQKPSTGANCQILGESLTLDGLAKDFSALNFSSLEYMFRTFPKGQIFSVDQYGAFPSDSDLRHVDDHNEHPDRSSLPSFPSELQNSLPAARSVLFLPLQDLSSNTFFAGLIGWTADPIQHVVKDDLISLRAFGNAVMSELARCEADYVSRAKSDFISSISHELRSPLHGVLASVELLNDSTIGESDKDVVHMIERCGTTLLDTLNHLLDYSQINRFNGSRTKIEGPSLSADSATLANVHGQTSTAALDQLIIDVVESVHLGVQSQRAPRPAHSASLDSQANIGIHVNIEHRATWQMPLHVGAWKRVVMNIFANSMKFTSSGFIEVLLSVVRNPDRNGSDCEHACLVISDSGIGMSSRYLEQQLFTPFIQEDSQEPGTGLGMSLVKQIVEDLGGVVRVESVQGLGTRTELSIPLSQALNDVDVEQNLQLFTLDSVGVLNEKTLRLVAPRRSNPVESKCGPGGDRVASLTRLISDIAQDWLGMKFLTSETLDEGEADFFIVCDFLQDGTGALQLDHPSTSTDKRILSIGFDSCDLRNLGHVTPISYPISPRSLFKALSLSFDNSHAHSRKETLQPTSAVLESARASSPPHLMAGLSLEDQHTSERKSNDQRTQQPQNLEPPTTQNAPQARQAQHALAVDDNAINLKILQSYLKKLGCTVATAINGLEAVEIYKSSKTAFDVVFMDISMPTMNGFEASRQIRSYEKEPSEQAKLPTCIIALTGLGSDASRQEAFTSGVDQFHTKPVKLDHIRSLLSSMVVKNTDQEQSSSSSSSSSSSPQIERKSGQAEIEE